jgi:hypothetical protein
MTEFRMEGKEYILSSALSLLAIYPACSGHLLDPSTLMGRLGGCCTIDISPSPLSPPIQGGRKLRKDTPRMAYTNLHLLRGGSFQIVFLAEPFRHPHHYPCRNIALLNAFSSTSSGHASLTDELWAITLRIVARALCDVWMHPLCDIVLP